MDYLLVDWTFARLSNLVYLSVTFYLCLLYFLVFEVNACMHVTWSLCWIVAQEKKEAQMISPLTHMLAFSWKHQYILFSLMKEGTSHRHENVNYCVLWIGVTVNFSKFSAGVDFTSVAAPLTETLREN